MGLSGCYKKWVDLVSLSTMIHIASYPEGVLGKPITKSMDVLSHFHSRISKGYNVPTGFWCSIFTFWKIRHLFTKLATFVLRPGHQNIFLKSWYILLMPGCIVNSLCGLRSGSFSEGRFLQAHISVLDTTIRLLYPEQSLSAFLISPNAPYVENQRPVVAPIGFGL